MRLTYKDIRALEFWESFQNNDLEKDHEVYTSFIDNLIVLQQSLVDSKIKLLDWQSQIDTLISKSILHCNTIANLLKGTNLSSKKLKKEIKIIDLPSLYSLFRVQLECFLMFDFIYCQPKDEKEKEFRYSCWMYYSFLFRAKVPAKTDLIKHQQKMDSIEIEKLKNKIINSLYFNKLTRNQQKAILDKGNPRLFQSWENLMELSFLNDKIFNGVYSILSDYSHTGAHSLMNLRANSILYHKNHKTAFLILLLSKSILSLTIIRFKSLFKITEVIYNGLDLKTKTDIEFFVKFSDKRYTITTTST